MASIDGLRRSVEDVVSGTARLETCITHALSRAIREALTPRA